MNNKLLLILILVMLVVCVLGVLVTDTSALQRPVPPDIQTWGIPNPVGYQPDCGDEPDGALSCGVMCYYIVENATENQHELTCLPVWFLP